MDFSHCAASTHTPIFQRHSSVGGRVIIETPMSRYSSQSELIELPVQQIWRHHRPIIGCTPHVCLKYPICWSERFKGVLVKNRGRISDFFKPPASPVKQGGVGKIFESIFRARPRTQLMGRR